MKVVFDTNVLVAAFLSEGVCYKLLLRARKRECKLVLSPDIIAEFEGVLLRKFSLSQSELTDVRTLLAEATHETCRQVEPIDPVSRDPDDDKILACASVSQADYLVTGDEDLLVIRQYGATKILSPRDFEGLFGD
ncbi:MAG: putative toxin-antitoxin system toxin component, PIN family [Syntrophorhabdaceae bacterium]|nr:putative toxin-antitoxin system toxin component, PIN family [Syntrophorhabdaceae bacterium]